ncbi:hypothetical protein PRVXH_001837 [Proteinivorax hydrogeniformans]|uniref:Uncharacterized protein n=1 Tax=Proteinivorax hydrogeniformans TaxID=1826727 RepID=A0AAU8HRZ2_9FIRM
MKYHDKSEDSSVMRVRKNREDRWESLIKKYEESNKSWDIYEILTILHDLQDYLCVDFPKNRSVSQHQIRKAFKNVCQVAISLAEKQQNTQTSLTRYETNKLCHTIKLLKIEDNKAKEPKESKVKIKESSK